MIKHCILIFIFANISLVLCFSNGVKEYKFTKATDESGEYDFEYEHNGQISTGRTTLLAGSLYFVFGPRNCILWVELHNEDFEHTDSVTKKVRIVRRENDTLHFSDDFSEYYVYLDKGTLKMVPYETEWDVHNVCFSKAQDDDQTFNFVVSSKNNSRKYNGTTYIEMNGPLVQRLRIDDARHPVYEVTFTQNELQSKAPVCKDTMFISGIDISYGYVPDQLINPNLLKSLAG